MSNIRRLYEHEGSPRLCEPDHWRLEPVYGEAPGYLVCLLCAAGHIHHAALRPTLVEARRELLTFQRAVFGRAFPIEDAATGRRIVPR